MVSPQKQPAAEIHMSAIDAIYRRRAVRDYEPSKISQATVRLLLDAAVHAPTARHEEPWAFAVVQDKKRLNRLSEHVKKLLAGGADPVHPHKASAAYDHFTAPDFNAFYNAATLIVICGKPMGAFVTADCWMAAQNLMLAACASGLGTCVIGLAVTALNTPEWKKELGISADMTAIAPIILGVPAGDTLPVSRKPSEILIWK